MLQMEQADLSLSKKTWVSAGSEPDAPDGNIDNTHKS